MTPSSTVYGLDVDTVDGYTKTRRHTITAPTSGLAIAAVLAHYPPEARDTITRIEVTHQTPLPNPPNEGQAA